MQNNVFLKACRLILAGRHLDRLYAEHNHYNRHGQPFCLQNPAIKLASVFLLEPQDYVLLNNYDDYILLALGYSPKHIVQQHIRNSAPSAYLRFSYITKIPPVCTNLPDNLYPIYSSGMQNIMLAAGMANGLQFLQSVCDSIPKNRLILCPIDSQHLLNIDVIDAIQMAVLQQFPVIFILQNQVFSNNADALNVINLIKNISGIKYLDVVEDDFEVAFRFAQEVFTSVREDGGPWIFITQNSALKEEDNNIAVYTKQDVVLSKLQNLIRSQGVSDYGLQQLEKSVSTWVKIEFNEGLISEQGLPGITRDENFNPISIRAKKEKTLADKNKVVTMAEAGIAAIEEIIECFPQTLLCIQDEKCSKSNALNEAFIVAEKFGSQYVLNATDMSFVCIFKFLAGLKAVGVLPVLKLCTDAVGSFAFFEALHESFVSKYYINDSVEAFPQPLIRIPLGYGKNAGLNSAAFNAALPMLENIQLVYPSNASDMKNLLKEAFLAVDLVVVLEQNDLIKRSLQNILDEEAIMPPNDFFVPLGKARVVQKAAAKFVSRGMSCCVITYGLGVYWAKKAANSFYGQVEIIDLRSLVPIDEELVFKTVKLHGKCLIATEEILNFPFAEILASRITNGCFNWLDAGVEVCTAVDITYLPTSENIEEIMQLNIEKLAIAIEKLMKL